MHIVPTPSLKLTTVGAPDRLWHALLNLLLARVDLYDTWMMRIASQAARMQREAQEACKSHLEYAVCNLCKFNLAINFEMEPKKAEMRRQQEEKAAALQAIWRSLCENLFVGM